jgi:hypothetical protein
MIENPQGNDFFSDYTPLMAAVARPSFLLNSANREGEEGCTKASSEGFVANDEESGQWT